MAGFPTDDPDLDLGDDVDEVEQQVSTSDDKNKKLRIDLIVAAVVLVVILGLVAVKFLGNKESAEEVTTQEEDEGEDDAWEEGATNANTTGSSTNGSSFEVGMKPDPETSLGLNDAEVVDADDYVTDLNGLPIVSEYVIVERTVVKDLVNYERRRASIDTGMEMYWIDIEYQERKYRTQIPYSTFITLDDKGICAVSIEVLTLENGSQVISYMTIVSDYKEKLNGK